MAEHGADDMDCAQEDIDKISNTENMNSSHDMTIRTQ